MRQENASCFSLLTYYVACFNRSPRQRDHYIVQSSNDVCRPRCSLMRAVNSNIQNLDQQIAMIIEPPLFFSCLPWGSRGRKITHGCPPRKTPFPCPSPPVHHICMHRPTYEEGDRGIAATTTPVPHPPCLACRSREGVFHSGS